MRNHKLRGFLVALFLSLFAGGGNSPIPPMVGYGYTANNNQPNQTPSTEKQNPKAPESFWETTIKLWNKSKDDPTAFFTLWLTLFTCVVATSTVGLWIVTWRGAKRQSLDMQASISIADKSANAAISAAEAATKQATIAERVLIGTEAPFVFAAVMIEYYRPRNDDDDIGMPIGVCIQFENFGRTPAIVRELYYCELYSNLIPDPVQFPPPQTQIFKMEIIRAGGKSGRKQICGDIPEDRDTFFVVGNVRYYDGSGVQYLSGFCFAYNRNSETFHAIGGTAHNYRRRLTDEEAREAEKRDSL